MATIRVARRSRFTTLHRDTVNDDRLSFRARGVLLWLLDKPDDWSCDAAAIARAGSEGRDAIRSALAELEAAGYLARERRQGEGGRWRTDTVVRERPVVEPAQLDLTGAWESGVGKPGVGSPGVGSPGANTKTETDDCDRTTPDGVAGDVVDAGAAARELVSGYWEWVRSETGHPPVALGFMALVNVVRPFLDAGYPDRDVRLALMSMHKAGRTLSRQSLEVVLQGRGSRPGSAPSRPVEEDRSVASGVVDV